MKRAVPSGITTVAGLIITGTFRVIGTAGMSDSGSEAETAGSNGACDFFVGEGNRSTFSPSSSHPLSPSTGFSGE